MPKFLFKGSYTAEGAKGLIHDGGTKRRAAVEAMVKKSGGTMESFYYAFGDADVYLIVDLPDMTAAVATSLLVNASGAVNLKTIPLFTVEEMDQAAHTQLKYTAPGSA
ncbi:MAG: GYD domain-containing protein [Gemmatimonadaceae bacterium]